MSRFSVRTSAAKPAGGLLFDRVPGTALAAVLNYMQSLPAATRSAMRTWVCARLDIYYEPDRIWYDWHDMDNVVSFGFFSQRPKPDTENCVKEAVGAVEGLLRVAMNEPKILMSDALKKLSAAGKLPPTLKKGLDGIYAFRGDAGGVAHGQADDPEVTIDQAEFVLHSAAAAIVYFAHLYGYAIV